MKRLTALFLSFTLLFALSACGQADDNSAAEPDAPTAAQPAPTPPAESDAPTDAPDAPETDSAGGKTLIAYFSWSGNTEALADMIAAHTGGDLFEIVPQTPYTDDYDALLDAAQTEQQENARPAVANQVENWDAYDTVFVGYPNWWSDAPMVVLSFLERYDCTGKTIVPFATSGGGGFGRSTDSITASAVGATILEGFHVSGASVSDADADVAAWIDSLGL